MSRPLSIACVTATALGACLAALFAWVLARGLGDGPADTVVALVALTMLAAQAVPMAGLPALLIARHGGVPGALKVALTVVAALLAAASLVLGALGLPVLFALGLGALFAARVGAMRRAWVIAWAVCASLAVASGALVAAAILWMRAG